MTTWRIARAIVLTGLVLLAVGSSIMAIRGYWTSDHFFYFRRTYPGLAQDYKDCGVGFGRGWMCISWQKIFIPAGGPWTEPAGSRTIHDARPVVPSDTTVGEPPGQVEALFPGLRFLGTQRMVPNGSHPPANWNQTKIWVHLGWVILASGLLPAVAGARGWRRRRERALSPCRKCGYSLIGNTSGVCPECGERI